MTAIGLSYRVIVRASEREPGRLVYELARRVPFQQLVTGAAAMDPSCAALMEGVLDPGHQVWDPMDHLTTPWCNQAQARQLALAWLRLTRREPVPETAVLFQWGVDDLAAVAPARCVGGVVNYATVRRRVWRPRRWLPGRS